MSTQALYITLVGREMSSILWAMGWRPSEADFSSDLLATNHGLNCLLMPRDGYVCHGVISSCQSAATSEIVKCFWSRVWCI